MGNSKRKGHTRPLGAGADFTRESSEPSSRRGSPTRGASACSTCRKPVVMIDCGTHWKAMDLLSESEHVCVVRKPTP